MRKENFAEEEIEKCEKFFYARLSECERRQYVGLQAMKIGCHGVTEISKKFNVHEHTIRKGKKELKEQIVPPAGRICQKGGGRKKNGCRKGTD